MEQYITDKEKVCRRTIDTSNKNWKRMSFNDFGTRYSQNFIVAKKKEQRLWKNLFLQKHMMNLMEE
ncbi:MAG: hypothetical protein NC489_18475 [Ruminococcus flavefaciens]|nr:hypothetical protein [Ruminococcus flavefaciens]